MKDPARLVRGLLVIGLLGLGVGIAQPLGPVAEADPEVRLALGDDELPYELGDPAVMAALGIVSHGPIAIGPDGWGGSEGLVQKLVASEWVFIETAHFRWASSMGRESLNQKDQLRLAAYFERMREAGMKLPKKVKKLDPRLRLLVMALRAEDLYQRFLGIVQHSDEDFPETRQNEGPYMGNGRFLGEADKFELFVHRSEVTHRMFTKEHMGTMVTGAIRWHLRTPHKMIASVPGSDSDLKQDRWLWPYIAHNLGHMFLAAYKHNSYDPPVWLDEGFALCLEREAEPTSITAEGEEGSLNEHLGTSDWVAELRKLQRKGEPRLAELMTRRTPGSCSELDLVACWSRVRFLMDEHPDEFAAFLGLVKGQLDEAGYPSGADMPGLQRRAFKELWGWSPADLDAAWASWLAGDDEAEEE